MLKLRNMLSVAAVTFCMAHTAVAQNSNTEETRNYPNWFVGVQGGGQAILNGYKFTDVVTPIGAVQGGAWFSPALGARLHVNGWKSKEGVKGWGTYKFDYVGANIDVMINLTNAFSSTDKHLLDVILLGGVGINKAWGSNYNDLVRYDETTGQYQSYVLNGPADEHNVNNSYIHNHVTHSDRVGLMLNFNVANNWSINLEGHANHIGSRSYAHEFNGGKDWQLVGLVGVTYKFGKKKAKPAPLPELREEPAPVAAPEPKPEPKPQPKPEPKPEVQPKKQEETKAEIFFVIAKTEPAGAEAEKVAQVAEWLKSHPTATVTVTGYADAGTGNATINKKYAEQRAQNVAKALTEKYGIAASRLSVSSCGDTVQPFGENDKNRVVIVAAKEK